MAGEGASIAAIDEAMKRLGHADGPVRAARRDRPGHRLRTCCKSLGRQAATRAIVRAAAMARRVDAGLARQEERQRASTSTAKSKKKRKEPKPPLNDETGRPCSAAARDGAQPSEDDIQWRLVLPMVNEAARLLAEGVTDSADAVDLATVLGLGFAPFRGGLAQFADTVGADKLVAQARRAGGEARAALRARRAAEAAGGRHRSIPRSDASDRAGSETPSQTCSAAARRETRDDVESRRFDDSTDITTDRRALCRRSSAATRKQIEKAKDLLEARLRRDWASSSRCSSAGSSSTTVLPVPEAGRRRGSRARTS